MSRTRCTRTTTIIVTLSPEQKVAALRELTLGADDVFAAYALSRNPDKDRWRPVYTQLSDEMLVLHLRGFIEIGSYPLRPTHPWPTVYWVLADFDGKQAGTNWKGDVQRAVEFLSDFDGCPCFVNLSRSGQGAHIRMLFREPVPAWMARRWMTAWLIEADVMKADDADRWDDEVPPSFDRLIPPQDILSGDTNSQGCRLPGNLAGSPIHGAHLRAHGGTAPLDTQRVLQGDFEPDGRHWDHVLAALDQRSWGEAELRTAIADCPGDVSLDPPVPWYQKRSLRVLSDAEGKLDYMVMFCAFVQHMHEPGTQSYALWVALATQLHRFGDAGREKFHEISALDPRYNARDTDLKWEQTQSLHPIRCDTLVQMGYRCPHLDTLRCSAAKAPAYFTDYTYAEIL